MDNTNFVKTAKKPVFLWDLEHFNHNHYQYDCLVIEDYIVNTDRSLLLAFQSLPRHIKLILASEFKDYRKLHPAAKGFAFNNMEWLEEGYGNLDSRFHLELLCPDVCEEAKFYCLAENIMKVFLKINPNMQFFFPQHLSNYLLKIGFYENHFLGNPSLR
jgi:hypothetical protein